MRPSPMARSKAARPAEDHSALPMSSRSLMVILSAAGFCCCVAMAVPFVHMVAFCGDLGFSPARGSEAIALILLTAVAAMLGALFIVNDPIFSGLAISLLFGIAVSTALTLLVIPLLYWRYLRWQQCRSTTKPLAKEPE